MQLAHCFGVIVDCSGQEPAPKRAQVLPPWTQLLVVVLCHVPQLAQAQHCDDGSHVLGHREQSCSDSRVARGGVPSDEQRIPHQFHCGFAGEQTHRAWWTTVPGRIVSRTLPPGEVTELNINQEKGALTCSMARRTVQTCPEVPVQPHYFRRGVLIAFTGGFSHYFEELLVELMGKLEALAPYPRRSRN